MLGDCDFCGRPSVELALTKEMDFHIDCPGGYCFANDRTLPQSVAVCVGCCEAAVAKHGREASVG